MTDEEFEKYVKAGEIAYRVKNLVPTIAKPGVKLLDLAKRVEEAIASFGGEPAFPLNISINDVAAHYTPTPVDTSTIPEGSVVKVDIGVHVDGYIADTAITLCFNDKLLDLVEAAREALEKALKNVGVGVKFSDIGKVIHEAISKRGYKPIYNLSGHSLDRYTIHAGDVIPNYRDIKNVGRFRDGSAYAIEPFATSGRGFVVDSPLITIYALKTATEKKLRSLSLPARKLYDYVYTQRRTLPFALRWYVGTVGSYEELVAAVNELKRAGLLIEYPVLVEESRGIVSQFEETIVIYKGKCYITTNPELQP